MEDKDIFKLLEKYKKKTISAGEKDILESWYNEQALKSSQTIDNAELRKNLKLIAGSLPLKNRGSIKQVWPRIAAAASILIAFSMGGYFLSVHKLPHEQTAQNKKQDIPPAHNQATLTLANGQKIVLKKGLTGKLASQGNTLIRINTNSMVSYHNTGANTNAQPVQYNTLSTSKGEQSPFPLELADGTKVWLNAMSSVTFPTNFQGKDRIVKITGEVFFEVKHNAAHPFKVSVKEQVIEDIGTQFNVNAYDDESAIETTLLEGSVKVNSATQSLLIKPGQQARLTGSGLLEVKNDIDTEEIMAWKNGFFEFKNTDIQELMRQISRWYDVKVTYSGKIPAKRFYGKIPRNTNASVVLRVLELGGITFKLEGRSVMIK